MLRIVDITITIFSVSSNFVITLKKNNFQSPLTYIFYSSRFGATSYRTGGARIPGKDSRRYNFRK